MERVILRGKLNALHRFTACTPKSWSRLWFTPKKLEYTIVYSKYFGVHCSVLQKTGEIWSVQPCTPFFLECGLVHSIHIWSAPSMHSNYFWCTPNLMCGVQVLSLQKKLECTLMHSKNLEYICIPWSASKSKESNDFSVPLR